MDTVNITYRINFDSGKSEVFDFNLDEQSFDLIASDNVELPNWTELSYRKCEHCPLDEAEHSHCPLAVNIFQVVDRFHDTRSIDEVELDVTTRERRVIQKTALQHAIASMFDVVFPTCGCPQTALMKPLARFHLPLASEEETVFRVTSMYLLAQYFMRNAQSGGGRIELEGLTDIYDNLHILNKTVASRLQSATQSDSVKNAITLLDMYSTLVPVLVEDELVEIRGFFKAFFPDMDLEEATTNYLEKAKNFSLELEPVDSADADEPDWMKEAKGNLGQEGSGSAEDMTAADKILSASGLSLSLEPIGDDSSGM